MQVVRTAKRGFMYGIFGSFGRDVYKGIKGNLGAALALIVVSGAFFAFFRAPVIVTSKDYSMSSRVLAVLLAPLYVSITVVFTYTVLNLLKVDLSYALSIYDTWTTWQVDLWGALLDENMGALVALKGYAWLSFYVLPLILPQMALGLILRISKSTKEQGVNS